MAETTYTQTAGMDGETSTDNVAEIFARVMITEI
jgi:hypothetical protein